MAMSDTVTVALIGAVPALFGAIMGIMNNIKIHVVHDAVNGGLAKARRELQDARDEIETLKKALM
jgi:hypothetical protein